MMLTDPFIIEYYLADEGIASQGQIVYQEEKILAQQIEE